MVRNKAPRLHSTASSRSHNTWLVLRTVDCLLCFFFSPAYRRHNVNIFFAIFNPVEQHRQRSLFFLILHTISLLLKLNLIKCDCHLLGGTNILEKICLIPTFCGKVSHLHFSLFLCSWLSVHAVWNQCCVRHVLPYKLLTLQRNGDAREVNKWFISISCGLKNKTTDSGRKDHDIPMKKIRVVGRRFLSLEKCSQ